MATSGVISFDYACQPDYPYPRMDDATARANTQAERNTFTPSPPRV